MTETTAKRSASAKAAYARRKADAALGIPTITSLAASLHAANQGWSKAKARREAVGRIEALRADAAELATWKAATRDWADQRAADRAESYARVAAAEQVPNAPVPAPAKRIGAFRRAVTSLALRLYDEKPWRGRDAARVEAEDRLHGLEGDDAELMVEVAQASYRTRMRDAAAALSRR